MSTILVIDTETSTNSFENGIPDGHIVEIGIARVDTVKKEVVPCHVGIINDPGCSGKEWIFKNADLTLEQVRYGERRFVVDEYLSRFLQGCDVTAYNVPFDRTMIERDLPLTASVVRWGYCLMLASAQVEEIPRKHAGSTVYPTAESAYNYLCPDDPRGLHGKERHRALDDALMEGHILLALIERGLYPLPTGESP